MLSLSQDQFQGVWAHFQQHQKRYRQIIIWVLSLYLVAYAADLFWRLMPAPSNDSVIPMLNDTATHSTNTNTANIAALQRLHLFGKAGEQPQRLVQQVDEAPETRLSLSLTGVVASNQDDAGAAIIESRGNQATYGVGEKIERTNVILHQVYPDRVILKNGANFETLMLEGLDYSKNPQISVLEDTNDGLDDEPRDDTSNNEVNDNAEQARTLSEEALETTRRLQQQPASFTDYIAIAQHREGGQVVGYRVSPGKNPALFEAAGLKANDVITEINGLDLTQMDQAMEAMQALREAESMELTVLRQNEIMTLYLDLPSA